MEFSQQKAGDILIIGIKGRLDIDSSDLFKEQFGRWSKSAANFVFDCTELDFLDSTGLGVLLLCLKQAMKNDGDIRMSQLNESVRMVMEITRADKIFQLFATTGEALSSFEEGRD